MDRILIYQTAFLGDALLAIPLLKNVRSHFPAAEIHLACRAPLGEFFLLNKLVDRIHEVKKGDSISIKRFELELKKERWSVVFCDHRSPRAVFLTMRLNAKRRVGFYAWWSAWRFDHSVPYDFSRPDALRQLSLLAPLVPGLAEKIRAVDPGVHRRALRDPSRPAPSPELPSFSDLSLPTRPLPPEWQTLEKSDAPWIFIAPGSQWATKRWTTAGFREFANDALQRGGRVWAVGASEDRLGIDELNIRHERFHNLAGLTTLTELLALFQRGKVLISNDSGLMHLASCARLPTVAIFGPTVLELGYEPWQTNAAVVEQDLPCRPCGKHGHDHCPIGTHACMKEISAARVIQRSNDFIHSPE